MLRPCEIGKGTLSSRSSSSSTDLQLQVNLKNLTIQERGAPWVCYRHLEQCCQTTLGHCDWAQPVLWISAYNPRVRNESLSPGRASGLPPNALKPDIWGMGCFGECECPVDCPRSEVNSAHPSLRCCHHPSYDCEIVVDLQIGLPWPVAVQRTTIVVVSRVANSR